MKGIYILAIGALALSGCRNEAGGNQPQAPGASASLRVRVEVASQTRSVVTGTAFSNGSQINIILLDAGATDMYLDASQPYTFRKTSDTDPGGWMPTLPEGLIVGVEPANVYAHHPATLPSSAVLSSDKKSLEITLPATLDMGDVATSNNFESFYMQLRPTDPDPTEVFVCRDDVDFLTGQGTQVSVAQGSSQTTTISMKHALAMVVVYVKKSPHLIENPAVSEIAIKNSGAHTPLVQGSFALADNAFTPNATSASYTRTMSGFPIDRVHYAMLVYPATIAQDQVEMTLKADATTYTIPMPAKTWASGKVYIYNVEISANQAQLGSVTVADWPEWIEKPLVLD